jgi:hypothetical protein
MGRGLIADFDLNLLIFIFSLRLLEKALVVLASPEKILHKVRKRKIHNALKEIVNQLFTFRPVCTTSKLKALYYRLNFFL